jgi:hypothetical protein
LEDELRKQFFRDHPFEAFRPMTLVEGGKLIMTTQFVGRLGRGCDRGHGILSWKSEEGTLRSSSCSPSSFIKRIVVTSSTVSIGLSPRAESQRTEGDWNEPALKEVRELGKGASGLAKYSASKTLAEKGGSDFHSIRSF